MGIDASIYSNIQPVQVNIPSPLDTAQKALSLSTLGMQQAQMARQMMTQSAVQHSYMANTDQNGNLDRDGFLSDLGKINPQAAMEYKTQFAQQDKQQAEATAAKIDSTQKMLSMAVPTVQALMNMPEEQRAAAYPAYIKNLKDNGVDTRNWPDQYDPAHFRQAAQMTMDNIPAAKDFLANQKTAAETANTQAQTKNTIAQTSKVPYEIAKIKSDIGNVQINRMTDYQKMLNGDEQYKKAGDVIASGKAASNLIDAAKTNAVAKSQLPFAIATMMNNGQPIRNAKEMDSFFENLPPGDKTRELISNLTTGKLDDDLAGKLQDLINTKTGAAADDRSAKALDVAKQYSNAAGIPIDEAHFRLTNKLPGAKAQPGAVAGRQGDSSQGGGMPGVKSAQASEKLPASAIKQGDVRKDHVFMGGDPSNQANWKKVR